MKVTCSQIKNLYSSGKHPQYKVLKEERKNVIVAHKIPFSTGFFLNDFPNYLKGFEEYYEEKIVRFSRYTRRYWELKPQYKENRPSYTFEAISYVLDIELTEEGKKEIQRRYNIHKRNMEKYANLMVD